MQISAYVFACLTLVCRCFPCLFFYCMLILLLLQINLSSYLLRWTFVSCKTGKVKKSLPFHDGFQQTINGIRLACSDLLANHGFRYVLTTRFNQDAIENWFASVRSKGYNNDTRTTSEYELSVKNVAVNWLLAQPSTGTNCSADGDSFLDTLEHITSVKKCGVVQEKQNSRSSLSDEIHADNVENFTSIETESAGPSSACGDTVSSLQSSSDSGLLDWSNVFKLSEIDSNVVAYICGYMCMKLHKANNCTNCLCLYDNYRSTHSCSVSGVEFSNHEMFIYFRNFEWAKHGLQKPTFSMFALCSAIEQVVQLNMETVVTGKTGVMCKLQKMVFSALDVATYPLETVCAEHQSQRMNEAVRLFLRVRIHHFVRIRNRELKELESKAKEKKMTKKDRKLEKIAHR